MSDVHKDSSHYSRLCALRDLITDRIQGASVRDTAALANQLVNVLKAIEEFPVPNTADPIDELLAKRKARADDSARTPGV